MSRPRRGLGALGLVGLALAACAHAPVEEDAHPCDLAGNERLPPRPNVLGYLRRELSGKEVRLAEDVACRPAFAIGPFDDDAQLAAGCDRQVGVLPGDDRRTACRHACLASARSTLAAAQYEDLLGALNQLRELARGVRPSQCLQQLHRTEVPSQLEIDGVQANMLWKCLAGRALPPEFELHFTFEPAPRWPAPLARLDVAWVQLGRLTRWDLALHGEGCGQSSWMVQQRSPWPPEQR